MALLISRSVFNNLKTKLICPSSCSIHIRQLSIEPLRREPEVDIEKLFLNKETQRILHNITGLVLSTMSRPIKQSYKAVSVQVHYREDYLFETDKPKRSQYKFVTKEEYEKMIEEFKKKAVDERLQLYPIMKERKPIDNIISTEPDYEGYSAHSMVFIDTSKDIPKRKRSIWVREANGNLRDASWEQRDRMNQIYYPVEDKEVFMPNMFEDKPFDRILSLKYYLFGLHRLCLQFEPDDPMFIKLTKRVYDEIYQHEEFYILRSSRFFGAMAFYYATETSIDKLLKFFIDRKFMDEAKDLIKLYSLSRPSSEISQVNSDEMEAIDYVNEYISKESQMKDKLELSIQTFLEMQEQKKLVEEGIKTAHGATE